MYRGGRVCVYAYIQGSWLVVREVGVILKGECRWSKVYK